MFEILQHRRVGLPFSEELAVQISPMETNIGTETPTPSALTQQALESITVAHSTPKEWAQPSQPNVPFVGLGPAHDRPRPSVAICLGPVPK